jgi:hypothetical protein
VSLEELRWGESRRGWDVLRIAFVLGVAFSCGSPRRSGRRRQPDPGPEMIVYAPFSLRDATRSAEQTRTCARRPILATVCGGAAAAHLVPGDRAAACPPSSVRVVDVREGMVIAAEVRRGGRAGARGGWALPAGARTCRDGACEVSDRDETLRAVHAGLVRILRQPGARRPWQAEPRHLEGPWTRPIASPPASAALTRIDRSVESQVQLADPQN